MMTPRARFLTLLIVFVLTGQSTRSQVISGFVRDNFDNLLDGISIRFVDNTDPTKVFNTNTQAGYYEIDIPLFLEETPSSSKAFEPYPNPFSSEILIPYYIAVPARVVIDVEDISGRKITRLQNLHVDPGFHHARWEGQGSGGHELADGFYIVVVRIEDEAKAWKVVKRRGVTFYPQAGINTRGYAQDKLGSTPYKVFIEGDEIETLEQEIEISPGSTRDFLVFRNFKLPFTTGKDYIEVNTGKGFRPFFVKGMNLGVSIPGTHPGELAASRDHYARWIRQIADAGFNSIRVYTLHYPRFYEELESYNKENPSNPVYLFQGAWLDEEVPGFDLTSLTHAFDEDIKEVVDCMHGNREIGHRFGKAYGKYTANVSRWIMGYIIGREIHPVEILGTMAIFPENGPYLGKNISLPFGHVVERWVTERIDKLIEHERETYNRQRPVSFSSWPTLDPIDHPTELFPISTEDVISIDLSKLQRLNAPGGYFASYHAYPYFPDFISEDPAYREHEDALGPNSYLGYLHDLKSYYQDMPLIIAEFGVPSSWGNAHFSHSGMDHGGHDERMQGHHNNRLMGNILESNCGGGMMFAWIDEWFKNSWITEPFGTGWERRPLWHNITSPEENYGLLAFDTGPPDFSRWQAMETSCTFQGARAGMDHMFFYLNLSMQNDWEETDTLWIGFDTYRADLGESTLPDGQEVSNRLEFCLEIPGGDTTRLFVTRAYDLFAIWHQEAGDDQLFRSVPSDGAPWNLVRWKNNRYEDAIQNIGLLAVSNDISDSTSLTAVIKRGRNLLVRIPWSLLQFTDPSTRQVMHDDRNTPGRETMTSDGIAVVLSFKGCLVESERFEWDDWSQVPPYTERVKPSYWIVKDGLTSVPTWMGE